MADERPSSFYPAVEINPARDIRIVELRPGRLNDAIHCTLKAQHLVSFEQTTTGDSKNPAPSSEKYGALSYTWGSWTEHKHIVLNQREGFPVTNNLWSAMRRIRDEEQVKRLWIDQISINQQDDTEKKFQVPLMGEIYGQATKVVVWLGDAPDFQSVRDKEERRYKQLEHAVANNEPPWHSRAWVIQEYLKARNQPTFCFGSCQTEHILAELKSSTSLFKTMQHIFSSNNKAFKFRAHLETFNQMRKNDVKLNLVSLAWTMQQVNCKNPKDKIYSLFSLLPPGEQALITVDYSRKEAAIYSEATYASIACNHSLTILGLVSTDPDARRESLPSWSVNFNSPPIKEQNLLSTASTSSWFGRALLSQVPKLLDSFNGKPILLAIAAGSSGASGFRYRWTKKQPRLFVEPNFLPDEGRLDITGLRFGKITDTVALTINLHKTIRNISKDQSTEAVISRQVIRQFAGGVMSPFDMLRSSRTAQYSLKPCHASTAPLKDSIVTFSYDAWHAAFLDQHGIKRPPVTGPDSHDKSMLGLSRLMDPNGPTLFITEHGFLGHGTSGIRIGDLVVLPYGSESPIALRRSGADESTWTFHGPLKVNGIEKHELERVVPELELTEQRYSLV